MENVVDLFQENHSNHEKPIQKIHNYDELFAKFKFKTDRYDLLDMAFTHHSYCEVNNINSCVCYRKLEFLGDSVLQLGVATYLYRKDFDRGVSSNYKNQIVSNYNLRQVATNMDLEKYIRYDNSRYKPTLDTIVANVLEAIFGVIYLTNKYEKVNDIIIEILCKDFNRELCEINNNPKCKLNEYAAKNKILINYCVKSTERHADNTYTFVVELTNNHDGKVILGQGTNCKNAEQDAALKYLQFFEDLQK